MSNTKEPDRELVLIITRLEEISAKLSTEDFAACIKLGKAVEYIWAARDILLARNK